MSRHAWFAASWPISIRELAARLQVLPFTDAASDGYTLERVRANFLEAVYFRKLMSGLSRLDPFGREMAGVDVTYQQTRFIASTSVLGLEMVDPPRGNQRFVSRLLEVCDFELSISPIRVSAERWVEAINSEIGSGGFVDTIQYGGIDIGQGASARVIIRGNKEVRTTGEAFISRPHQVEKLQLRLAGDYKGSSILLSNTGTAKIVSKESAALLVDVTRTSLLALAAAEEHPL